VDGGSDAPPGSSLPKNCKEAATATDAGSAVFEIDPDGTGPVEKRPVLCDFVFEGGGWALIESFAPGNGGPASLPDGGSPPTEIPSPGFNRVLPGPFVAELVKTATQVHIRKTFTVDAGSPLYITSKPTATQVMANLGALKIINLGLAADGGKPWELFDGPQATEFSLKFLADGTKGCTESLMQEQGNYPSIYWACGNEVGLHVQGTKAAWTFAQVANDAIEVYVR
jgi:hypothetical protein